MVVLFFTIVMSPKTVSGKDGSKKSKHMMTIEIKHEIVDKCGAR